MAIACSPPREDKIEIGPQPAQATPQEPAARLRRTRDAHERFTKITTLEHSDEGRWSILKTVSDVLAIADVSILDARRDDPQEIGIMLGGKLVVYVTA